MKKVLGFVGQATVWDEYSHDIPTEAECSEEMRMAERERRSCLERIAFWLSAFIRLNRRRRRLAALTLILSAVQLQLCFPAAGAESERKNGGQQQWSLRVDKVDTGDVSLDPSFESALHKSLLRELAKTKRFRQVLFNGDRSARDVPDLLILKMTVQEYAPDGETRRATLGDAGVLGVVAEGFLRFCGWSAGGGVNKLNARIQLYTREGRLVLNNVVEGDVGFNGDNSRAAHNLAHNVADTLMRSTLPDTAMVASEQETASISKYQVGTITATQCHQAADADAHVTSCEVSLRIGNTAYAVLYAPPVGTDYARYETGRELPVLVGEDTITYTDMLGNSFQVHILSRASVTQPGDR